MKSNELPVPESVLDSERSMELARIWIAEGRQVLSLSPNLWSDPGNWGLMFIDFARHLSEQYAEAGWTKDEVMSRIRAAFDAEWNAPTDVPQSDGHR